MNVCLRHKDTLWRREEDETARRPAAKTITGKPKFKFRGKELNFLSKLVCDAYTLMWSQNLPPPPVERYYADIQAKFRLDDKQEWTLKNLCKL